MCGTSILERFSRVYICPIQSLGNHLGKRRRDFATITFNATDIRSITFTYASSSMFADPTYQHIGIYNIDYTVVPEPGALEICSIIGALTVWTSRSRKRQNHDADTSMTESPVSNETS